jgi:Flp pilus assembly protein TadD
VEGGWRFVTPTFDGDVMTAYVRTDGRGSVPAAKLGFLSLAYVRSQYDYYRAERAVGGVLGTGSGRSTPDGLKTSETLLRQALKEEPGNALAASVLGTVMRKQGRLDEARAQYRSAGALYTAQGHLPAGMTANLVWANGTGWQPGLPVLATLPGQR